MSDFDFNASKKNKPRYSGTIIGVIVVSVFFVLSLGTFGMFGALLYLTNQGRNSEKAVVQKTDPTQASIKKHEDLEKETSVPIKSLVSEQNTKDAEDRRNAEILERKREFEELRKQDAEKQWQLETKREYLEALRRRADRMSNDASRFGSLGKAELRSADLNFKKVKSIVGDNPDNASRPPRSMLDSASRFDPRYIRGIERENGLQLFAKMGKSGAARLPWRDRKKLHKEFS